MARSRQRAKGVDDEAKKPHWGCGKCGFATNWACTPKCHGCGNGAPYKVLARIAGAEGGASDPSKSDRQQQRLPQQCQQQLLRQQLDAAKRTHAVELQKLKDENAELRQSPGQAGAKASCPDADDMELDSKDALNDAVARARSRVQKLKDMPQELRDLVDGGYDACLARLQAGLAEAQASRRAANPLRQQLDGAEEYKVRMEKKLAAAKAALAAQEQHKLDLLAQIEQQRQSVAETEAALAKAAAEVAELAARFAPEQPRPAVVAAEGQLGAPDTPPPGYVSRAFAEEKWAEREAAFAQQLEQLQALVGAPSETPLATESVASDFGSVDDLEDDEKWSTVAKGRRHALLRKQKDELASKVRTKLGKVQPARSPFAKRADPLGR